MDQTTKYLQASYDRVAEEYGRQYFHEFDHKPLDRELLDRFAERVRGLGPVCDMGCGPGEVACYLYAHGVEGAFGVDLSAGMVEQARRLNPDIEFHQGDMLSLDADDESWGGIAAFYSIIHIPREQVVDALREMFRVLRPGGLLLTFHIGQEILHVDGWWGEEASVDFIFFELQEMEGYLKSASFEIEDIVEREPYEGVEYQSRRAYIFAEKPDQNSQIEERKDEQNRMCGRLF